MRALRAVLRGWRYLYGENPLHLLVMIGCFALVGYVVTMVVDDPSAVWLLVWFAGAVLGHDLVMYPLYALADQPLVILRWARRKALPRHPAQVPMINHIRMPVLGSAVLGLIYLPTITQHGGEAFQFASGHPLVDQYGNWLLITGTLFLASAVIYVLRVGGWLGAVVVRRERARRAANPGAPEETPGAPEGTPEGPDGSTARTEDPTEAIPTEAGTSSTEQ